MAKQTIERHWLFVIGWGLILIVCVSACQLTTTTLWKPIERKEYPAYLDRVAQQNADSVRVVSIESGTGEVTYKITVKQGATDFKKFITKQ